MKYSKDAIIRYLKLIGVDPFNVKLMDYIDFNFIYKYHTIETRIDEINIVNKISNFNGICYIYIGLDGQTKLDDSILINHIRIYWDNSINAKRQIKLKKLKSKLI